MKYRNPNVSLIVMARAPVAGQVKTRLSPPLTPQQAARLQERLINRSLRTCCKQPLAPVELQCAPDSSHPFFLSCASRFPISLASQVGDDLGQRMHHALEQALKERRYAVLIGSDCPQITPDYLEQAMQALRGGSDLVLGPAEDGGYVLIGLRKPQPELFEDMPWGGEDILSLSLQRAMELGLQTHLLPTLQDVDRPEDLVLLRQMAEN